MQRRRDRLSTRAPDLRAFIYLARDVPERGLHIAVKDNIDVRGMPTTAGGRHLDPAPRARDAECVRRLRVAGCVFVGKTNLYEYAMGGTSHNEHYGDVRNPRDLRRDAGGSSSGSGAAVAAGLCDAALGTDTLGSVRIPASFCGVVGYKPPRSAIPRSGVFPNSESFDSVGVLAPDAKTAVRVVDLMRREPVARRAIRRPRLAVPWSWLGEMDGDVRAVFERVARGLPDIGLPALGEFAAAAFPIVQYESYRLHRAWFRSGRGRYGAELRALLRGSARVTRSQYDTARRETRRLRRATGKALGEFDAVIMPTVPCVAPLRSERRSYSAWTLPFNVSDSAVFTIPLPTRGMPIGLQIVANDEATAIAVALWAERRLQNGRL